MFPQRRDIAWLGEPLLALDSDDKRTYYARVQVDQLEIAPGDYVRVLPDDPANPLYIGKVIRLFDDKEDGQFLCHIHWLR